jgi:hypothetical protein
MIYPGSTPEFRILVKQDGTQEFQLRYVNITQGYTGKWQVVPVVKEEATESIK